jgi:copper homeostasis protein
MAADVLLEVCVDSVDGALAAAAGGASRLELCAGLCEGGTTPSAGMMRAVRAAVPALPLHVLVRPRGGDFVYSAAELSVIRGDIAAAAACGAVGVAIGALRPDGAVDEAALSTLVAHAKAHGLAVTVHRALDASRSCLEALRAVLRCGGVDAVLTSGGAASAMEGAAAIAALVAEAQGRVSVIAAGGVTPANACELVEATGVRWLHGSASRVSRSGAFRNSRVAFCSAPSETERRVTDASVVAALIAAARAPPAERVVWRLERSSEEAQAAAEAAKARRGARAESFVAPAAPPATEPRDPPPVVSHLPLSRAQVGCIMGQGGANAALICRRSGARLAVHRPSRGAGADDAASALQTLAISGSAAQVAAAERIIAALLEHQGALPPEVEAALPQPQSDAAAPAAATPPQPLQPREGPARDALMRKLGSQLGEARAEPRGEAAALHGAGGNARGDTDAGDAPQPQPARAGGRGKGGSRASGPLSSGRTAVAAGGQSAAVGGSTAAAASPDAPQGGRSACAPVAPSGRKAQS